MERSSAPALICNEANLRMVEKIFWAAKSDFFRNPLKESKYDFKGFAGRSPIIPDNLEAASPHVRLEGCILQEGFGVKGHLLNLPNLKSRPPSENFIGYLPEVIHEGAEENRFFEEQGFQDIMTTYPYQASPHKDKGPDTVKFGELPKGIQEDDGGFLPMARNPELGLALPWDFMPLEEDLDISQPFEMSGG